MRRNTYKQVASLAFLTLSISSCSLNYPASGNNPEIQTTTGSRADVPDETVIPPQVDQNNIENFYVIDGRRYAVMRSSVGFNESGIASWYGDPFHGRKTSNGETYDMYKLTAAHKHLPLPSYVEVTNALNGKSAVLRVNDRGPFVGDRVIDLSFAAAQALDIVNSGTAPVNIRGLDELNKAEDQKRIASPERPAYIQIASFSDSNNAYRYHQQLLNQGISNSRVFSTTTENNQLVYRTQVGPLKSGDEYDQAIKQLSSLGINKTILIRE